MSGDQQRFQQAMSQGHSAAWEQMWQKAAEFYQQALAEIPNHPLALTSLGLALFELKVYPEALRYYQMAAKVTPEDPIPVEKNRPDLRVAGKTSRKPFGFICNLPN